jgi:hypothetical protein
MSSHSAAAEPHAPSRAGTLSRLLGPAFGFLVWAIHFLVLYIAAAVACVFGLGHARSTPLMAETPLVGLTIAAIVLVVVHAVRRYPQRAVPEQAFRTDITIGCDAIAAMAIAWQLFAILLVPPCV